MFPREASPTLRITIQIINFIIITLLFLKQYGFYFHKYPRVPDNLKYFILSLLLLMLVSSINSNRMLQGIERLIILLLFLYLIYLIYALIKSDVEVHLIIFSLFICSIFSLLMLFNQALKFSFDLIHLYQNIFFSQEFYLGKNNVGVMFSIATIFLISLLFIKQLQYKKYLFLLLLALLLGLLITNSRASILCLLISVVVILYMINKKMLIIVISGIGVIIIILSFTSLLNDIQLYLRVSEAGSGREYLIGATIEVIKNNFLLGAGPAGTRSELYSNLPYLLHSPQEWVISVIYELGDMNQTHNYYLYFFSDLGIVGLLLSLALPTIYFINCRKVYKAIKSIKDTHYYIILGLVGSGIFIFTRGLVEQMNIISYGAIYYDLPFWLLVSILTFYTNKYAEIQNQ